MPLTPASRLPGSTDRPTFFRPYCRAVPEYYDAPVGRSRRPPSPPVTVEPWQDPLGLNLRQRYPDGREDLLTAHSGIDANSLQLFLRHAPASDAQGGDTTTQILLDRPAVEALRRLCDERLRLVDEPFGQQPN